MAATADDDDYEVIYEVFQTITVTVSVELLTTMFLLNSFPKFVCVCCKLNCDRTLISWYGDQVHLSSNCMEIHISLFISFCLFIWKKTKKPTSLATRERERESISWSASWLSSVETRKSPRWRVVKKHGKRFQIGLTHNDLIINIVYCFQNSPLYWSMVDAGLDRVGGEDVHKNIETSSMCTELHTTACNKVLFPQSMIASNDIVNQMLMLMVL